MTRKPPHHFATLLVLLALTAATAAISSRSPAWLGTAVLAIALVKMILVTFRFMNLRLAHPFWKCAVVIVIAAFISTLGLLAIR